MERERIEKDRIETEERELMERQKAEQMKIISQKREEVEHIEKERRDFFFDQSNFAKIRGGLFFEFFREFFSDVHPNCFELSMEHF